jgi:hypothetical protein
MRRLCGAIFIAVVLFFFVIDVVLVLWLFFVQPFRRDTQ